MANTLTSIAPVLYSAAQEVSNEPFGVVSAINTNFDNKGVAYGDTIKIPVAPMSALEDFTASNVTSTGANSVASAVDVTISAGMDQAESRSGYEGTQELSRDSSSSGYKSRCF
jgi:hypothetical protein